MGNTEDNNRALDKYFANLNLDKIMGELSREYNVDNDPEEFNKRAYLNELRSDNHYRYYNIDLNKLSDLTEDINVYTRSIKDLYKLIDPKVLLTEKVTQAEQHKAVLDKIYDYITVIDKKVDKTLKELTTNNNVKQSKFSIELFRKAKVSNKVLNELIDLYSELVIIDTYMESDKYNDLKNQIKRKRNISRIYNLLNIKEPKFIDVDKSEEINLINDRIERAHRKYMDKLQYLGDILPKGKEFKKRYNKLKNNVLVLFSYDDRNISSARKVSAKLQNNKRMDDEFKDLEILFIDEIERIKKEKDFVFDKVGYKNMKRVLDYINAYYMDVLDEDSKAVIKYIINNITAGKYNPSEMNKALHIIIDDIWANTITDIKDYYSSDDYYFLCTNNPFIDEKYQAILISKKEIAKVNDYADYQIGFICGYNQNILYATENEDIMSVRFDDMSNLKTPKQIEDEFISFKICNRIALDGYKTKLQAVYIIDDGDRTKMAKALDLSSTYNLPVITIKKDN